MCDTRRQSLATPRWGRLYAIVAGAIAVLASARFLARAPAVQADLELGVAAVTFTAMWWWVRANSAALDRLAWCSCASATVTVRLVGSQHDEPQPEDRVADALAERSDAAPGAELEVVGPPARRA